MIEIKMPRLSDTMEEGAIATWRKQPGDAVAVGAQQKVGIGHRAGSGGAGAAPDRVATGHVS